MSHRVVLDTNCIISALIFSQQKMSWLRHSWQNNYITPLVSKDTIKELLRVLAYPKFKLSNAEQELLLADFLPYTEVVVINEIPNDFPIIRDRDDQKFLILAVTRKAKVLVSGDTDILVLKSSFNTSPIMTIEEFKNWVELGALSPRDCESIIY